MFGEYCQIHEDNMISSTMKERTIDAIALKMKGNSQGSAEFLSLNTWRIVTRNKWITLPMPNSVIDKINEKAVKEKRYNIINEPILIDENVLDGEENEMNINNLLPNDNLKLINTNNNNNNDNEVPIIIDENINDNHINEDFEIINADDNNIINDNNNIDDANLNNEDNNNINNNEINNELNDNNNANDNIIINPLQEINDNNKYNLRPRRNINNNKNDDYIYHVNSASYKLKQSLKQSGSIGIAALFKELKQLHKKEVWTPIKINQLNKNIKKKAIRSRIFLKIKSDGRAKGRLVAGGDKQDKSIYDDLSSSTVSVDNLFSVCTISAFEKRRIVTLDIEGAYLNCDMKELVYMELDPFVSELLLILYPNFYSDCIDPDTGKIYVILKKALYGLVESAKYWYEHITNSIKQLGYIVNPYDNCVFNKYDDNGNQCTIVVYVDDLIITSVSNKLIDELIEHLMKIYKKVQIKEGKVHNYLGMQFTFKDDGSLNVEMNKYINDLLNEYNVEGTAVTPATNNLFDVMNESPELDNIKKEMFHTVTAKLLYLAKRSRPDILLAVSYLTTRVNNPNISDSNKLQRVLKYLNGSKDLSLTLYGDGSEVLSDIDTAFAIHNDYKGHTGATKSLGKGTIHAESSKQHLNTKSSTETELVGLSDYFPQAIHCRNFLIEQGYKPKPLVIHQDNQSVIAMIKKGKPSSKYSRHINIRYFFIKDKIEKNELIIKYKSTNDMIADILTKPLQGSKFKLLRKLLLNLPE
jgi:hypothetical protein